MKIYYNGEFIGEIVTNRSLTLDEMMYALGYDRFDWQSHEGEEHGDYVKDGEELYAEDIMIGEE